MKLIFGLSCDGPSFPDFPGLNEGVFNAAVVGPQGLVEMLEVQLGLTAPRVAHAVRVSSYAAKLRAALATAPELFFAQSLTLDPWATAASLLEWRDQLVAGGWSGAMVGAARIDAFAKVEGAGDILPPGITDRARSLCEAVKARASLPLTSIELVEPRDLLPPLWQALIEALETSGAKISRVSASENAVSDLSHVQAFLEDGSPATLAGDGSFVIVEADTALTAAEAAAEWLAHCSEAELHGTVIVNADGDTALLDGALRARGLPALGLSASSPWRGALQVLPLAFAASWAPFNAKAMLDLLMLPRPPIPRSAARKLAYALSREPGTGGAAWIAAWAAIESDLSDRMPEEPQKKRDAKLDAWRQWTSGALYQRHEGMPAEAAKSIASRVAQWALETNAGTADPLFLTLVGAATALTQAIDVLNIDILSPLLLGRMIDQVLADGAQNPNHVATSGGLRAVRHPGAIWDQAKHVLWWDFKGPGESVTPLPWSREEIAVLKATGCNIESPAATAARIGWSNANAVHRAGERLILFSPALSAGEETTSHPLAHQLNPLTAPAGDMVRWSAEQLLQGSSHELAGRKLFREAIAPACPPMPRAHWSLPASVIAKLDDRIESATSLEHLADCQIRWLLLDVLRLSRGRVAEIPGTNQLLGNLAHELANRVFPAGSAPDPDTVFSQANSLFDELLSAIAAPLQQPEYAGELAAARVKVPAALAQLAQLLKAMDAKVIGTEIERERKFVDGPHVKGRIDMLVEHPAHGTGVIDLKWSRSVKHRRNELAEGRSIQLATYGAIANPNSAAHTPGAFYMLDQRQMIGLNGTFLAEEVVQSGHSLPDTWTNLVSTWQIWRDLARSGTAVAAGVHEAEAHIPADLPIEPGTEPCRYCELTALCRVGVEAN
ncbi:PD-(D/E)XK nuclease family protein [Sphingobium yanoikuyae]|uniref:PD-(D/E)XK nuclease family protein n=1 Tax=Sphingobium yanoikuyae TaxID=13690 RepID=UPI0008469DF7|nr:PD-(D/E)XK nuclease family protein [Sphingobium yanoikuyae]MDG2513453.1 PD-(D/E)XK nuclease family protein [Sphingobium yanoikuyae]